MMKCEQVQERLPAYLEGDLEATELQQVRGHLGDCQPCQKLCDSLERTWEVLGEWQELAPSPTFQAQVWEKIRTAPPARAGLWSWLTGAVWVRQLAASVAVVMLCGWLYLGGPPPQVNPAPTDNPPVAQVTEEEMDAQMASLAPDWDLSPPDVLAGQAEPLEHLEDYHLEAVHLGQLTDDWLDSSHDVLREELGDS